jgi:hypothetical protein
MASSRLTATARKNTFWTYTISTVQRRLAKRSSLLGPSTNSCRLGTPCTWSCPLTHNSVSDRFVSSNYRHAALDNAWFESLGLVSLLNLHKPVPENAAVTGRAVCVGPHARFRERGGKPPLLDSSGPELGWGIALTVGSSGPHHAPGGGSRRRSATRRPRA